MISVGKLTELNAYPRYTISLRSKSLGSKYHSIVLYGIDSSTHSSPDDPQTAIEKEFAKLKVQDAHSSGFLRQWHAMEEECPHLGASMTEAEIEIEGDGVIAICPWHNYDFDLRTGESSSGLKACVFPTSVRDGELFVGYPNGATDWELIYIRPVSQRFALPDVNSQKIEESIVCEDKSKPTSLLEWGALILRTGNPELKVNLTRHAIGLFRKGELDLFSANFDPPLPPDTPIRESVRMIRPEQALKRGKGGNVGNRIKMLHALANIELWAIDLAWDIMVRFSQEKVNGKRLPRAFFTDFCKVAEDEAKHFTLLQEALRRLGSDWGQLPIHDGLWQSARDTSHSLISRLCIIHLVHEARGLDVNPTQIKRVRAAGDLETAESLSIIHSDEVTHVAAGHRWLCYICEQSRPKMEPVKVFRKEVETHFYGKLKAPFNVEDRLRAGLEPEFYEDL
ncbi:hypothetical protein CROQUDRAFT_649776 [Cronartium quercuum f. sp. fusiforme G11]|uniref:Rieske domain-containing protein n=1 Tax=Cronartium quercuum f. sp. fusiforme G11 TaxID=708437 RepID=A0A9P6THD1_9BASI|nr:hypothetical protein CROQUDRAFT_649776 [Cronartium quercuum f. sp. fusiforme G11]